MNTKIVTQYGTTSQDDRRWLVWLQLMIQTTEWNFFSSKNIQNMVLVHYLEKSSLIKRVKLYFLTYLQIHALIYPPKFSFNYTDGLITTANGCNLRLNRWLYQWINQLLPNCKLKKKQIKHCIFLADVKQNIFSLTPIITALGEICQHQSK